jgi:hypothetical protein
MTDTIHLPAEDLRRIQQCEAACQEAQEIYNDQKQRAKAAKEALSESIQRLRREIQESIAREKNPGLFDNVNRETGEIL